MGSYLPENKCSNEDLSKYVDTSDEWISKRSGIKFRHFISNKQTTSDMAVNASIKAIKVSMIKKEDIDLIIVATTTPDNTLPSTATIVQKKLGIKAASFDIQAVCAGFVFALSVAKSMMIDNSYKNCLVIGADAMSKLLNWNDRTTSYKNAKFDIVVDTKAAQANVFELTGMYHIVKHVVEVSN